VVKRKAQPPELGGYSYVELIGQGGFADVFLYEEHRPSRPVAVKVLISQEIDGAARRRFDAEANVMAQLASHPSIVPIYKADVGADGRPFLVMEYCPGGNLAGRYRTERLSVQECLDTGIRVAGGVETAHRAGILHRDIKPHNILLNAYDHPKLTDFGIAVIAGELNDSEVGLSVPWSPPEMFEAVPPEDRRSDVYSLAATVYTLLAGRSPFELPSGGASDPQVLIHRIENSPLPRLARADVSDKLNDVLARAMSRDIEARYASANSFARALQDVQIEMHVTPTRIDVLDSSRQRPVVTDDDGRTRISPIAVIIPDLPIDTGTDPRAGRPAGAVVDEANDTTRAGRTLTTGPAPQLAPVEADADDTMMRSGVASEVQAETVAPEPRSRRAAWLVAAAAALLAVGVAVVVVTGGDDPAPAKDQPSLEADDDPGEVIMDSSVPAVSDLAGVQRGDSVTFTWTNPDPQDGDFYLWQRQGDGSPAQRTTEPKLTFTAAGGESVCVTVRLARAGGGVTPEQQAQVKCAEVRS
jgi:serine/threonine protein kinase